MKATVEKIVSRIEVKPRKQDGILGYDVDNNYPNRVREIVASSGMGKTCVDLYRKYIFGGGFQDTAFAKKVINSKGLTPDKLGRHIARDYSNFGGFYIHVNYNALYEKSEVNFQPLSHVRLVSSDDKEHAGMYAIYKDWGGKRIKKEDQVYINKFNPDPRVIESEVIKAGGWQNYRGQLYLHSDSEGEYPMPIYDAVLEDMLTDRASSTYKLRNATTNFMASHILKISKIEGDDNGVELRKVKETVAEFQGAEEASKVMVVEVESEDQIFKFDKVDQQNGDREFEWTETSSRQNIMQKFLIPPALLMQLSGKIAATSDEVIDATKSYNSTTSDERLAIEEAFRIVFTNFHDKTITPEQNFSLIEKKAVTKDDATKKKDIIAVCINAALTIEQKRYALIYLYNIPEEEVLKLLPNVATTLPAAKL